MDFGNHNSKWEKICKLSFEILLDSVRITVMSFTIIFILMLYHGIETNNSVLDYFLPYQCDSESNFSCDVYHRKTIDESTCGSCLEGYADIGKDECVTMQEYCDSLERLIESGKCNTCKDGYVGSQNTNEKCVSKCEDIHRQDVKNADGKIESCGVCLDNYKEYDGICKTIEEHCDSLNRGVDNNTCGSCKDDYFGTDNKNEKCVEKCSIIHREEPKKDTKTCGVCLESFIESGNICYETCQNFIAIDPDDKCKCAADQKNIDYNDKSYCANSFKALCGYFGEEYLAKENTCKKCKEKESLINGKCVDEKFKTQSGSLSEFLIACIVLSVIALLVIIVIVMFYYRKKSNNKAAAMTRMARVDYSNNDDNGRIHNAEQNYTFQ